MSFDHTIGLGLEFTMTDSTACFQFIPKIRTKALKVHRVSGYISSALLAATIPAALSLVSFSFGADIALQASLYIVGVAVSTALYFAITAVRRGDVDQHRKWMLRTWAYASFIITLRVVDIIGLVLLGLREKGIAVRPFLPSTEDVPNRYNYLWDAELFL